MRRTLFPLVAVLLGLGSFVHGAEPKTREFLFTYQATVTGLKPGQTARVWLPVPPSNREQEVTVVKQELPAKGTTGTEAKYGNAILFGEAKADAEGKVPLRVTYRVKRHEVKAAEDDHQLLVGRHA